MSVLPAAVRRRVPDALRDNVRLRAAAVGSGLIPARALHSEAEARLIERLARDANVVVEIGVYEGASAKVLASALPEGATLHLIDPFGHHPTALRPGNAAVEWATKRVVTRAAKGRNISIKWHVDFSENVGKSWNSPIDLVFIDGDHAEEACAKDWELFSPHVPIGGRICFHDAREGSGDGTGLTGPTAVVNRLFRDSASRVTGWEICEEVDRCVAVRRSN